MSLEHMVRDEEEAWSFLLKEEFGESMIEHIIDGCQCTGKYCKQCKQLKCLSAYSKETKAKDGLQIYCRECSKSNHRKWREENAEYNRERIRKWHEANREWERERGRSYARSEHGKAVRRGYRQRNAERIRVYERERQKDRYWTNRERHRANYKAWRERNAEYDKMRHKLHYAKHPEQSKKHNENWYKTHPGYSAAREHNRRARKRAIAGNHTYEQIQDLLKRQKYTCYYCSMKFAKVKGKYIYHIDHTFPISRVVGTDIPANDISYLVLTCPTCNQSKSDKFPWEFPEGGKLL